MIRVEVYTPFAFDAICHDLIASRGECCQSLVDS